MVELLNNKAFIGLYITKTLNKEFTLNVVMFSPGYLPQDHAFYDKFWKFIIKLGDTIIYVK